MKKIKIAGERQFPLLDHCKQTFVYASLTRTDAGRECVAVRVVLRLHNNVENTGNSLCVVFCAGVSDYFHAFYRRCRVTFEYFSGIAAHEFVGLAINVNFETPASVNRNFILPINGHEWHFSQHIQKTLCLGFRIIFYGIIDAIARSFHQRRFSCNYGRLQIAFAYK